MSCPYCEMTTAGEHQPWCPLAPKYYRLDEGGTDAAQGWFCPACRRINAPWVETCPCGDWAKRGAICARQRWTIVESGPRTTSGC